jgi:hypothetical protein
MVDAEGDRVGEHRLGGPEFGFEAFRHAKAGDGLLGFVRGGGDLRLFRSGRLFAAGAVARHRESG